MIFESLIYQWADIGLFSHILPFLLIFAVVFGILDKMKLFSKQKGVQVIIAVVLGLLAIRTHLLGDVLAVISPRLGVGLVILLALLVLIGLFVPDKSQFIWGFILMGVGVVIFLIILGQLGGQLGWFSGSYGGDLIAWLVLAALIIGVIVAISATSGDKKDKTKFEKLGSLFSDD